MFRHLKDKIKVIVTDHAYYDEFLGMLITMFDYDNLPFRKGLLESLLLVGGNCGIYKDGDTLICGYCIFTGNINRYGFGEDVTIMSLNGISKDFKGWEDSKDCVVIFNNNLGCPDVNIDRISKYLSDIDKSIENAIQNTRNNKVYRARDEKEKKALELAIESNKDGRPTAIVSSNILDDFNEGNANTTKNYVIDLTDPSQVDKIQYLCNLHTSIIRRMLNIYGMMSQGTDKIAQQTTAEINNGSSFSFVIPLDRLAERKEGIRKINENFGLDIIVKFSEPIQREYDRIFKEVGTELEQEETEVIDEEKKGEEENGESL